MPPPARALAALLAVAASSSAPASSSARDWSAVQAILSAAVAARTTPGLAAGVRDSSGALAFFAAAGNLTYGEPTPLGQPSSAVDAAATLFDMASCSKLIGPVTAAARLYQLGLLALDAPVADRALLGPRFASHGKGAVTVRNLLLHDAGFAPDPSPSFASAAFGCPATGVRPRPPLTLSCVEQIFAAVLALPLASAPGARYVYSDLSMITLLFAVGRVVEREALARREDFRAECLALAPDAGSGAYALCAYEAFWRLAIKPRLFSRGAGAPTTYLPDVALWPTAMPTYWDAARGEVMQGAVSDANAYASGGVSGHAGLFSTLGDVLDFTAAWQYPSDAGLLNATTVALWTRVDNATFSPRALGWLTQAPTDPYQGCGNFSAATFYHTGYTGQEMCVDPARNISAVLLTSRVYTNESNVAQIQQLRQDFSNAVLAALGA
jgi:CubicO group peptidase (beta-lactamase class C family)